MMRFFEYPYVIITSLVIICFVMGIIGLFFTMKSVKTAKGTGKNGFCSFSKLGNDFDKFGVARKNRCLIYISVSLENFSRLYSESKANRIYEMIQKVLLMYFGLEPENLISIYDKENFVALTDFTADEAEEKIQNCFAELSEVFQENDAVNVIRINFGCHVTGSADVSFNTALLRAKQALSMAVDKNEIYSMWDSANGKEFERKLKIENNIENEIDNNRFFLEYQPVIDAKTDKIIGAEVLSRLNSSTEGILSPRVFLSAVNNVGLNQKFDYYIFEKNCKWISNDKEKRMKNLFTINFSRFTLCDENLSQNIIDIIEKYNIDYSCIAVEILEDKSLSKTEKSIMTKNLLRLKEKGILILLDDFGKGYTNFRDLADFDIDIVKIDKSITQNADNDTGFAILKNIIRTAHDLGFKTLCEGIETEQHKRNVVAAGCDIMQGYYFYRPMPVTQLESLFEK
ncbi:MAG: EAL domain-containing protein [Ruminococcaceae bacterium]|nr:EAL domain-containing protein [Oscillospiraceae bacterium]